MFKFISKKIIKNYNDYNNPKVREQYGMLCSIVSIACNIVLVIFKLTMGAITHSIAIQADGLNNLSDVGSNLASLFGFKLANRASLNHGFLKLLDKKEYILRFH